MAKSSKGRAPRKPRKPGADFPLHIHGSGRWAKKVRGKRVYFGKVADDPDGQKALKKWLAQRDELLAGHKPRPDNSGLTLERLCNEFLHHRQQLVDSGELSLRTWKRYQAGCKTLLTVLGRSTPAASVRPEDFQRLRGEMTKRWGAIALGVEIQMVRTVFKYGYDAELLDRPVRFGPGFKKPSAKTLRQSRIANGPRMFTREQILQLLAHSTPNMKAMILMAINGGLGNTDLGTIPRTAVDLKSGWLDFPRAKTAIPRRIPLWPETIAAINETLATRRKPKDAADDYLLFIGKRGESYEGNHKGYRVVQEFARICEKADIKGRSFYDLRRTFQTVAEDACDLVAVQTIMGHAPPASDMSSIYRQRVKDERLEKVVNVVRDWLFKEPPQDARDDGDEPQDRDVIPFRIVG